jgi:type II secretory pathway component GspD/PulD (secretin)
MRASTRALWAALALVAATLTMFPAQADEVEVVPLRHRLPEQVIPDLRPMLEQGGALSGTQNAIVIRSSRKNIEDLKRVIAAIDTPSRRLMIYVRQSNSAVYDRSRASVSGSIGTDDANVSINNPGGRDGVQGRILDTRGARDDTFDSQVQALEGYPAYIATGQTVPVPTGTTTRIVNGRLVQDSTVEFRDISSGVYVVPRVVGDRVMLEISPQRETPGAHGPGSANIQHLNTSASGRLGEWIELGGTMRSSGSQSSGVLSTRSAGSTSTRSVWVKVEELK